MISYTYSTIHIKILTREADKEESQNEEEVENAAGFTGGVMYVPDSSIGKRGGVYRWRSVSIF